MEFQSIGVRADKEAHEHLHDVVKENATKLQKNR